MSGTTQEDLDALREHFARGLDPIFIELHPEQAFALVGWLQLALRHPLANAAEFHTIHMMRELCDVLIHAVADGDERIADILRQGYDPAHDQSAGGETK